jgi:hypothetical protein
MRCSNRKEDPVDVPTDICPKNIIVTEIAHKNLRNAWLQQLPRRVLRLMFFTSTASRRSSHVTLFIAVLRFTFRWPGRFFFAASSLLAAPLYAFFSQTFALLLRSECVDYDYAFQLLRRQRHAMPQRQLIPTIFPAGTPRQNTISAAWQRRARHRPLDAHETSR